LKVSNKEYLILSDDNEFCILYDIDISHNVYYGVIDKSITSKKKMPFINTPIWDKDIICSSSLAGKTSSGIRYRPPFNRVKYESVWAFSVEKDISPFIEMMVYSGTKSVIICNGMIYPENMNFYGYNARPKDIEILYNNKKDRFQLKDTPNPQLLTLSSEIKSQQNIHINILSYYKGEKYSDAVISFIGFMGGNIK
jgi:hypothetical protein